jgi:hypothetical protein
VPLSEAKEAVLESVQVLFLEGNEAVSGLV